MSESCAPRAEPALTSLSPGGGCGCKIAPAVLQDIMRKAALPFAPPADLLVGTETSDDAAVYRLSDDIAVVATTDFFMPIVDDARDFGRIAATNALSDVYAMGARPIMALAVVGMPTKVLSLDTIATILRGGAEVCAAAGVPVAGGHSIDSTDPIYGLIALGVVHPARVRRNAGARAGDRLVLGKPIGVGVLATAMKRGRASAAQSEAVVASMTQLNTPGPELAELDAVHALTDVTGFGLAGHGLEMARGSRSTLVVQWGRVPLFDGAEALAGEGFVTGASKRNWLSYGGGVDLPSPPPEAQAFGDVQRALLTDPQTSGGLLVACAPEAVAEVLAIFARHGFARAAEIGWVEEGGEPATGEDGPVGRLRVVE